ncbi:hypothetical protein ACOMHN_036067 [Nucella lapillus]
MERQVAQAWNWYKETVGDCTQPQGSTTATDATDGSEQTPREKHRESVRRHRQRVKQNPQLHQLYKLRQRLYHEKYLAKKRARDQF